MNRRSLAAIAAAFTLTSAAVYRNTRTFDFLSTWDDRQAVLQNPDVRELSLRGVLRTFSRTTFVLYQPVTTLTFAVDHALWGFDPAAFHVVNVILHAAAAFALFLLVQAISRSGLVAGVAATLFLVHPINVENVAWVTERKTILSALLSFAAMLAYVRARERGARLPWVGAAMLGAAAMLAKPSAVVLPVIIAAYERWQRPDTRIRFALPLVPLSVAATIPTLIGHLEGPVRPESFSSSMVFGTVYPSMTIVFWKYARLIAWPAELSAFYDTALYGWLDAPTVLAAAGWVAILALVALRGSREVRFWFAWFWICLLPTSNLLPLPVYYADRYLYTPAVGVFVLVGMAVRELREALRMRGHTHAMSVPVAVVAALALASAVAASRRTEVWRDDVTLWEDTVERSPNIYVARLNLGSAYGARGRYDEAERQYLEAERLRPTREVAENLVMIRAWRAMSSPRRAAGGAGP